MKHSFLTRFRAKIQYIINLFQGKKKNGRQTFRQTKHHSGHPAWTIQHVRETMRRCRDIQDRGHPALSRISSLKTTEAKGVSQ